MSADLNKGSVPVEGAPVGSKTFTPVEGVVGPKVPVSQPMAFGGEPVGVPVEGSTMSVGEGVNVKFAGERVKPLRVEQKSFGVAFVYSLSELVRKNGWIIVFIFLFAVSDIVSPMVFWVSLGVWVVSVAVHNAVKRMNGKSVSSWDEEI
jgi:hypothetical protein